MFIDYYVFLYTGSVLLKWFHLTVLITTCIHRTVLKETSRLNETTKKSIMLNQDVEEGTHIHNGNDYIL